MLAIEALDMQQFHQTLSFKKWKPTKDCADIRDLYKVGENSF